MQPFPPTPENFVQIPLVQEGITKVIGYDVQ